jgi:hypothetical protein
MAIEPNLARRLRRKLSDMSDFLVIGGIFVGWIILQAFVLPRLGIST